MQLLLWEWCRKTNQLSGLKSRAINSSFNYPEQNFINICKLHPTYFHMTSGNPLESSPQIRGMLAEGILKVKNSGDISKSSS